MASSGSERLMSTFISFLSYLLAPIVAPLVMIFRRKDYFALYHACQALAVVAGVLLVLVLWAVLGWLMTFVSITVPQIYLVPIVLALVAPIWGMFKRSRRYQGRGIWGSMAGTAVLAVLFSWLAWKVISWLAADVLPLAGTLLQMASFALVIAAVAMGVVGLVLGMLNALRGVAKKVPLYGGWGNTWFNAITRRDREALEASDAAAALAASSDPARMADLDFDDASTGAQRAATSDSSMASSTMSVSMDT
jgi:uncharacterized membrane protein